MNGKKKMKFIMLIMTLIHPEAVYMLKTTPGIGLKPSSPKNVTAACRAGPMMKPKTCASEIIDTAPVLSSNLVASDR